MPDPHLPATDSLSERFNHECRCISLDAQQLERELARHIGSPELMALLRSRFAGMFSSQTVLLPQARLQQMRGLIEAFEVAVAHPVYQQEVLARSPDIVRQGAARSRGVFFGYDFHVHHEGFGLIEVNTNAGGAMLNAVLARAQQACCEAMEPLLPSVAALDALEARFARMFREEWALCRSGVPLQTLAIVDDGPQDQYLYPEFLLFQHLLERDGLRVVIADPGALQLREGRLWLDDLAIDLVYNRLTDFVLDEPGHAVLRQAHLQDAVVLTPHPRAHALYADKRNLALLGAPDLLSQLGLSDAQQQALLQGIPRTVVVQAQQADALWAQRKQLFFKPFAGFGSRAAYRGDKLTRRVWDEIVQGGYIAQALVQPGERALAGSEHEQLLKFDVRAYVYAGEIQSVAARLYQGQTTNFRTPGGGFAPVYPAPD